MVKKGNFNKAPLGCFFKIYRYWYTDLLFEVKFYLVSEHFPDDSDELAGTVPKCIVMRPAFRPLGIIVSLEVKRIISQTENQEKCIGMIEVAEQIEQQDTDLGAMIQNRTGNTGGRRFDGL